jgi:molecular chaperone GrpE (heat shock protein)
MNLFPGGSQPKPSQTSSSSSAQAERLVESLKVQLSEKTNDYLRMKEENERLKEHLERHDSEKQVEAQDLNKSLHPAL